MLTQGREKTSEIFMVRPDFAKRTLALGYLLELTRYFHRVLTAHSSGFLCHDVVNAGAPRFPDTCRVQFLLPECQVNGQHDFTGYTRL